VVVVELVVELYLKMYVASSNPTSLSAGSPHRVMFLLGTKSKKEHIKEEHKRRATFYSPKNTYKHPRKN
jgi:hypothetical protein